MSMMFRAVIYGPCSRTGVTRVASDFGGIIVIQFSKLLAQETAFFWKLYLTLLAYLFRAGVTGLQGLHLQRFHAMTVFFPKHHLNNHSPSCT